MDNTRFLPMSTCAKLYGMDLGVEEPFPNALGVLESHSTNQDELTRNEDSFHAKSRTLKPKGDEFSTLALSGGVIRTEYRHLVVIDGKSLEQHGWNAAGFSDAGFNISLEAVYRFSWEREP